MDNTKNKNIVDLAVQLSSAYMYKHSVERKDVESLVIDMCRVITSCEKKATYMQMSLSNAPAVPINESVHHDYIVCLEDGRKLKMLKRHLKTMYNMTIQQYKERWALPDDYPTVAPSYAEKRSQIAQTTGLGLSGRRGRRKGATLSETQESKDRHKLMAF